MSNSKKTSKLSLTSETLRDLSSAELVTAVGGTSLPSFTCFCFNVGGNAPGINVAKAARRLPRR